MKKNNFRKYTQMKTAADAALTKRDFGALDAIADEALRHHKSDLQCAQFGLGFLAFFRKSSYSSFVLGLSTGSVSKPGGDAFFQKVTGMWLDEKHRIGMLKAPKAGRAAAKSYLRQRRLKALAR